MMRHETAREEFRGRCGAAERPYLVLLAVGQNKDSIQGGTISLGDSSIAVPGSSVHPYAAVFAAQDDAVVTQHASAVAARPQARRSALACSGVACEKQPSSVGSDYAAAVDFHAFTRGKAMNPQKFVQWIFQRIQGLGGGEIFARHFDAARSEIRRNDGLFVG